MKTANKLATALLALCLLSACEIEMQQNSAPLGDPDPSKIPTGVATGNVIDNLGTSAAISGAVASDGGSRLLDNGIAVDTVNNFKTGIYFGAADTAVTGEFSVVVRGLQKNKQYFYRAYSLNANGAAYGEIKSFTTANVTFSPYRTKFDPTKPADIADWVFDQYTGFDESGQDLVWFSEDIGETSVACYHDGEDLTIVSPLVRIASAADVLSFKFYAGGYGSPETKVKVYITEDRNNLGTPVKDWTLSGGPAQTAIPLASYFEQSIYVVIVVESGDFIFYDFAIAPTS